MSKPAKSPGELTTPAARPPRRARGQLRVDALLASAAEVFAAKGFESATMTEIAAQADSSIGSLYQFFRTKETVAAALLAAQVQALWLRFDELAACAPSLPIAGLGRELALLLVGFREAHPSFARLIEAPGVPAPVVGGMRVQMRERLAAILRERAPELDAATLAAITPVVQQAMKAGVQLQAEFSGPERDAALLELQHLLAGYLEARLGAARVR